jgi:thymidylate kinase
MSDEHGALVRAVWALVLAREKRLKIRKSIKARERGFIVICDRFPQTQVSGMIDGTLLDHWMSSESKLLRSLARWEADSYTLADTYPPDLVIRLDVTSETAASRRPEAHRPVLDHRRQVVESLMFKNARFGLRSLDANRDLDDVLLDVKHALWEAI